MKRAGSFSNKVMAVFLSMAMFLMPVLQSTTVYASEIGSGAEETGKALSDEGISVGGTTDGTVSGNGVSDEPVSPDPAGAIEPVRGTASSFSKVGGWNECIYAEIAGVDDTDVTAVSYSGTMTGSLTGQDLEYLVRSNGNGGVRIDIPGLTEGTYTLTVTVGANTLTETGIKVYPYDRSGFAHFNYTSGVGAYKDDGTLKDDAIVLYVTDANKNDVTLTYNGTTVKGIGNILNSVGQASNGGLAGNGGKANTNQGIIKKLARGNKPLVVRFIGTVSESGLYAKGTYNAASPNKIEGLTVYSSADNGGTEGDNGHMARIQSGKDITLEGIGYDATIDGWGFHYICQSSDPDLGKSFEVRNLTFINTPEDAVGMEGQQDSKKTSAEIVAGVERCWIHHNEFYCPIISSPAESDKSEGDGSVDFKRGQYLTCSYNYFEGCHKTNLVGSADYSLQYNLTYHHNHWYMCKARGPLSRNANIHMYNNIVDMQTDYAQNTRANAYIFSEYNLFYVCKSPQAVEGGAIKSYHDSIASVIWKMGSQATVVSDKSQYVPNACQYEKGKVKYDKFDTDAALSYIPGNDYYLNEDFTELRQVITSQTGVLSQAPKLPSEVTASEYSVLPAGTEVQTPDLPFTLSKPEKVSKRVYAFTVGGNFNLKVAYAAGAVGILTNEAGENLLEGDGEVMNLPAGTYMIQPMNFQPGAYLKNTVAVFKEVTINTLEITASDPSKHYHKWVKDTSNSQEPTCTEGGQYRYTCSVTTPECPDSGVKVEDVPAKGHSYSSAWTIDVPATATAPGSKSHHCTRCGDKKDITEIPPTSTGTGGETGGNSEDSGNGGGITVGGDYVLTFDAAGKKPIDEAGFFQVSGNYAVKGPVTVNGVDYKDCLKIETSTKVSFSCNEGAKLVMFFDQAGKKVKVDGNVYTTDSEGKVTIESLSAGSHEIKKVDSMNLFYVAVENGASEVEIYTLSFEYNYDDALEARTVTASSGTVYSSMAQMVPTGFMRRGYVLSGLYRDASCQNAVAFPYVVNGNDILYADWTVSDEPPVAYNSLIFNTDGGSAIATVLVAENEIYELKQRPTKTGYVFAGWYDAQTGGRLIDKVDGSQMNGNYTVYAHWSVMETDKRTLNCETDLTGVVDSKGDITAKTTVKGFTIHAASGSSGDTKYYMSVKKLSDKAKSTVLYTNGVRLTDTGIPGNEDGMLKSIEFTTESSGDLSVEMALSGDPSSGKTYDLVLARRAADGSYEEVGRSAITQGTTKVTKNFEFDGPGVYYLYAEGAKGVVYYKLTVTEEQFAIIYQTGEGTAPEGLTGVTAKAGQEIAIGDCVPTAGNVFKGWSADGGQTVFKGTYTVRAEDARDGVITLRAIYDALKYTVKFDPDGGTLPEGLAASAEYLPETVLTIGDCTPPEGKKFLGWSVGKAEGTFKDTYTVNAADADAEGVITIKAVYVAEDDQTVYCTVTLDPDGGTLVGGGTLVRQIAQNSSVDFGQCEKAGYVFQAWTEGGAVVTMPYTVTKDVTLKALYRTEENPVILDEGLQVELENGQSYTYTGAPVMPKLRVYNVVDGIRHGLIEGVDYTVKYTNNIKANAYGDSEGEKAGEVYETSVKKMPKITVRGKGSYGGSKEIFFKIKRKNLEDADVYKGGIVLADGSKAVPILVYSGLKLSGKDYVIDGDPAKTYRTEDESPMVRVKAKDGGNYYGSVDIPVRVVESKQALTPHTFTASLSRTYTAEYNGTEQTPGDEHLVVTAKDENNTVLKQGMDYEVSYSADTVNAGTVKFTVVGVNEYTGTISKTYRVNPRRITFGDQDVVLEKTEYDFVGGGVTIPKSEMTVSDHGLVLLQGKDYRVSYSNNKQVGTARYNISFMGNYQGSAVYKGSFVIKAKNLNNDTAEVVVPDKIYGKKGFYKSTPIVTIDGTALKTSDYDVTGYSYSLDQGETWLPMDNSNKLELGDGQNYADVRIQLKGKGNYTTPAGEAAGAFYGYYRVCKKSEMFIDMTKARVTFYEDAQMTQKIAKLQYTGGRVRSVAMKVEVKVGKDYVELQPDQYTAHWMNNVNKGKATVVIIGTGSKTESMNDQGALKNELAFVGSKNMAVSIVAMDIKTKANVRDGVTLLGGNILNGILEKLNGEAESVL